MLLLLWPALVNRYPLVFSDSGTYLSQIVERHLGWDRPIFYSLMILPLHLTLATWPVIVAQAATTWWVLVTVLRCFVRDVRPLPAILLVLGAATALPWVTAQLMPDFATGLLTLLIACLVITPERLGRRGPWIAALGLTALISVHQANLPLVALLLLVLLPLRRRLGAAQPLGRGGLTRAVAPLLLATAAMTAVNLIGHGRLSPSPYGNLFVLARNLVEGPAMDALRSHCPHPGWRLCVLVQEGPPPDTDAFLWQADSALYREGGPTRISAEADAILRTALRDEPLRVIGAALRGAAQQVVTVRTGDGLNAWPHSVSPVIARDVPPAEQRLYAAALQTRGALVVPEWLQAVHLTVLAIGAAAAPLGLALALRRRHPVAGLCAAVLVCLIGNAAITGALSGPHDRYESRVAWLVVFTPLAAAAALRRSAAAPVSQLPGQVQAGAAAPGVS